MFSQIKPGHQIKNWNRTLASTESKAKLTMFLTENWKEEHKREKLGNVILMVNERGMLFQVIKRQFHRDCSVEINKGGS